jgi:hypothetical protein
MPIMLRISRRLLVIPLLLLVARSALATEDHLSLKDVDGVPVELHIKNRSIKALHGKKPIYLDAKSKAIFAQMQSISVVSDKTFLKESSQYFWAFIRFPSNEHSRNGYCGAGTEDYLYLFHLKKDRLLVMDGYLAQSCLKSFSIDVDGIEDLKSNVDFDAGTGSLYFIQTGIRNGVSYEKSVTLIASGLRIEIHEAGR